MLFKIEFLAEAEREPGLQHRTIDRSIYCFEVNEAAQGVRSLAIFFGG
jgi:hypothetical protein